MKRVVFLLSIFVLALTSCNSSLSISHETVEIVSTKNVVSFKDKRYSVINNKLYLLENNSLKKIASQIEINGAWNYIRNIFSYEDYLIIINNDNLYFVDENLTVQYKFSDFKTSSTEWVQIGGKLFFLDDDINCRNLAYFDVDNKTKTIVFKKVARETSCNWEENIFYIDVNYDLHLVKSDMCYLTQKNEVQLCLLNYGLIN